jgi:hypothetical protein
MLTPERPGRRTAICLRLTPEDRATLHALLRSSRCPYGLHKRARAVLLLAAGMPITEIARRVERPGPVRRGLADMLEREGET